MDCTAELLCLKLWTTVKIDNSTTMFSSHLKTNARFIMLRTKKISQHKCRLKNGTDDHSLIKPEQNVEVNKSKFKQLN